MRVNITLACTECGDRNYISKKNKRNKPLSVSSLKSIASVTRSLRYTVKQSKQ